MREKILGIALSAVGAVGLIISLIYVSTIGNPGKVTLLLIAGILGAAAFFVGLRLLPRHTHTPASTPSFKKREITLFPTPQHSTTMKVE